MFVPIAQRGARQAPPKKYVRPPRPSKKYVRPSRPAPPRRMLIPIAHSKRASALEFTPSTSSSAPRLASVGLQCFCPHLTSSQRSLAKSAAFYFSPGKVCSQLSSSHHGGTSRQVFRNRLFIFAPLARRVGPAESRTKGRPTHSVLAKSLAGSRKPVREAAVRNRFAVQPSRARPTRPRDAPWLEAALLTKAFRNARPRATFMKPHATLLWLEADSIGGTRVNRLQKSLWADNELQHPHHHGFLIPQAVRYISNFAEYCPGTRTRVRYHLRVSLFDICRATNFGGTHPSIDVGLSISITQPRGAVGGPTRH